MGVTRLTSDDDRADGGALELRSLEDEDLGPKVAEGEEIGEQRQVIDAVNQDLSVCATMMNATEAALTACCECCMQRRSEPPPT